MKLQCSIGSIKAKSITVFKKHFFLDVERVLTSIFTSAKTKQYCKQNFMIPYKYWYLWFFKTISILMFEFLYQYLFVFEQTMHSWARKFLWNFFLAGISTYMYLLLLFFNFYYDLLSGLRWMTVKQFIRIKRWKIVNL